MYFLAFNRVKQKLRLMLKNAGVPFEKTSFDETWVPQFDTRATGFNLAELAVRWKAQFHHPEDLKILFHILSPV